MRLRGWHVEGFGVFSDFTVDDLPSGLTIVHGPNEAGKSTLLAFIRGVLFGFEDLRDDGRIYPPLAGGPHGGRLVVTGDDGDYVVERYVDPPLLTITRPDGSTGNDTDLAWLVGNADSQLFSNVFAFSLTELEALGSLTADGVRDQIFSAGIVGAGRSARSALAELRARREALYRPRSSGHQIGALREELRTCTARLGEARRAALSYPRHRQILARLDAELVRLAEEIGAAEAAQRRAEALAKAWPDRRRAEELRRRLSDTAGGGGIDEHSDAALERGLAAVARAKAGVTDSSGRVGELEDRLRALTVDDAVAAAAGDIRALHGELSGQTARAERIADLDRAIAAQRRDLDDELTGLGPDWDRERVLDADVSIASADEARTWGRRLRRCADRIDHLERDAEAIGELVGAAARDVAQLGETLEPYADVPHEADLQAAAKVADQLRHAVETATEAARSIAAREATLRGPDGAVAAPPTRKPASQALQLVMLVVAVLFTLIAAIFLFVGRAGTAALCGTVAAGAATLAFVSPGPAIGAKRDPDEEQQRAAVLEEELAERRADLEAQRVVISGLAARLELPPDPDLEAVASRERDIAAYLEALAESRDLVARYEDARTVYDNAHRDHATTLDEIEVERGALTEAEAGWREWKHQRELPPSLTPEAAIDFFATVKRARSTLLRVEQLEAERASLTIRSDDFVARAEAALLGIGVEVGAEGLAEGLRAGLTAVDLEREARSRRNDVVDELASARSKRDAARRQEKEATQALKSLFDKAGVADEAGFRSAIDAFAEHRHLAAERGRLDDLVRLTLGELGLEEVSEELDAGTVEEWKAAAKEATVRKRKLEAERDACIRRHQDASKEAGELATTPRVAELALEEQDVAARLADAVREWQRLRIAEGLLSEALDRFEQDRQPVVLDRARDLFSTVTAGHYDRLVVRDRAIELIDSRGRRLTSGQLSRGTAEQLYLCIRFGLATELASHTELPMVLDDVLVNFDPDRARSMAEVIVKVAEEHQVLLFTCHPHTTELFGELCPDARSIPLGRYGQPATDTERAGTGG